ncbi:MAG TPA: phosphatidylglycerol lysyltransferase domain-containing protein [Marmoricola sp.]|nr:phosphatidylglycerol lysyltransferase domain-containing protein [Marmoricola sp.]
MTTVRRIERLVDLSVDDPLAPFVLRPGKRHVFSPDGRAAIGYRVRFGVAVVGGDPVGDRLSWPAAAAAFVAEAEAAGHRLAVLAAGEHARELWTAHGLAAVPIGRDVVLRPEELTLQGRHFRNLRQAVKRTHNAGVTVCCWREAEVPEDVRAEIRALVHAGGRDADRGFSMILGRQFDGSQPAALVVVARDRDGRLVGAHRYLRAGEKDLSLDVPVRAEGAPNGVDERLIVDTVAWAAEHGVRRVSLAFAPFPDLFAERHHLTGRRRLFLALVHLLDPLIRVERLYRYLRKFHAFDQERFVMLRWAQLPRVAAALLWLEFRG